MNDPNDDGGQDPPGRIPPNKIEPESDDDAAWNLPQGHRVDRSGVARPQRVQRHSEWLSLAAGADWLVQHREAMAQAQALEETNRRIRNEQNQLQDDRDEALLEEEESVQETYVAVAEQINDNDGMETDEDSPQVQPEEASSNQDVVPDAAVSNQYDGEVEEDMYETEDIDDTDSRFPDNQDVRSDDTAHESPLRARTERNAAQGSPEYNVHGLQQSIFNSYQVKQEDDGDEGNGGGGGNGGGNEGDDERSPDGSPSKSSSASSRSDYPDDQRVEAIYHEGGLIKELENMDISVKKRKALLADVLKMDNLRAYWELHYQMSAALLDKLEEMGMDLVQIAFEKGISVDELREIDWFAYDDFTTGDNDYCCMPHPQDPAGWRLAHQTKQRAILQDILFHPQLDLVRANHFCKAAGYSFLDYSIFFRDWFSVKGLGTRPWFDETDDIQRPSDDSDDDESGDSDNNKKPAAISGKGKNSPTSTLTNSTADSTEPSGEELIAEVQQARRDINRMQEQMLPAYSPIVRTTKKRRMEYAERLRKDKSDDKSDSSE